MKIRYKLLIPVSSMLLLAVLTVSFIAYTNMAKEIDSVMHLSTEKVMNDLIASELAGGKTEAVLEQSLNSNFLRITRSVRQHLESEVGDRSSSYLKSYAQSIGIEEIHIIDENGLISSSTIPEFIGFDFSLNEQTKPFLRMLTDKGFELAQKPSLRAIDNSLFQYIAVPFIEQNGFVQIGVKPQELQALLVNSNFQYILENYNFKENEYAYVINPETSISTYHTDNNLIGSDLSGIDFAEKIMNQKNGSLIYNWEGREIFSTFKMIDEGILVAATPTELYEGQLHSIIKVLFISSIVSLLILLSIVTFVLNRIMKPLHLVNDSLEEIASGEADLTKRIKTNSTDEIGEVAANFNLFMDNLQLMISDMKEVVTVVGEVRDNMGDRARILTETGQEIDKSIDLTRTELLSMNEEINISASSMEQIATNTSSLDEVTSSQAASVEETTASITEMIASLGNVENVTKSKKESAGNLIESTTDGQKQISKTSSDLSRVVSNISEIQEIAEVINSIAEQTNLLSMNAAIEAAHAGDSGRGFAVVAEEIRKLATTTGSSANSISQLIKEITSEITNTSTSMDHTLKVYSLIADEIKSTVNALYEIENSVTEISLGGQQILESTQLINSITMDVNNDSMKINEGVDSTNRSLAVINKKSETVAFNMKNISRKSEMLQEEMGDTKAVIGQLDKIIADLSHKFDQFTA